VVGPKKGIKLWKKALILVGGLSHSSVVGGGGGGGEEVVIVVVVVVGGGGAAIDFEAEGLEGDGGYDPEEAILLELPPRKAKAFLKGLLRDLVGEVAVVVVVVVAVVLLVISILVRIGVGVLLVVFSSSSTWPFPSS